MSSEEKYELYEQIKLIIQNYTVFNEDKVLKLLRRNYLCPATEKWVLVGWDPNISERVLLWLSVKALRQLTPLKLGGVCLLVTLE